MGSTPIGKESQFIFKQEKKHQELDSQELYHFIAHKMIATILENPLTR
jgi:hypothetical protein